MGECPKQCPGCLTCVPVTRLTMVQARCHMPGCRCETFRALTTDYDFRLGCFVCDSCLRQNGPRIAFTIRNAFWRRLSSQWLDLNGQFTFRVRRSSGKIETNWRVATGDVPYTSSMWIEDDSRIIIVMHNQDVSAYRSVSLPTLVELNPAWRPQLRVWNTPDLSPVNARKWLYVFATNTSS